MGGDAGETIVKGDLFGDIGVGIGDDEEFDFGIVLVFISQSFLKTFLRVVP